MLAVACEDVVASTAVDVLDADEGVPAFSRRFFVGKVGFDIVGGIFVACGILARAACERVVSSSALEDVVAVAACELVIFSVARDLVVAFPADDVFDAYEGVAFCLSAFVVDLS